MIAPPEIRSLLSHLSKAFSTTFEELSDEIEIFGARFDRVGLSAQVDGVGEVCASAAGASDAWVWHRATFELIERLVVVQAASRAPKSAAASPYLLSKSNGVAAHVSETLARQAAAHELIERSEVLRSWYGASLPQAIKLEGEVDLLPFRDFRSHYQFAASRLGGQTYGVFAFPKESSCPLSFGFASATDQKFGVQKAFTECMQRLAFLWGEPLPSALPEESASIDFHLDYFLYPASQDKIRSWLEGGHFRADRKPIIRRAAGSPDQIQFSDLTPPGLEERARVIRASSSSHLSLAFGTANPDVEFPRESSGDVDFRIHPIA